MIKAKFYLPKTEGKIPLIVGLPGFLHESERSRIDCYLEKLCNEHSFAGIRLNFSGIIRIDKKIICYFNLKQYVSDIQELMFHVYQTPKFNHDKIGFVASSVSSGVFGHYLTQAISDIRCCALISPLPGWKSYATEEVRKRIERAQNGIPLTQPRDFKNGIERYIPQISFEEAQKMDALSALQDYKNYSMRVLTLLGNKDNLANIEDIRSFHKILVGKEDGIFNYECGHDIPYNISEKAVIDFFVRELC